MGLPKFSYSVYTHTHIYIYIYVYIYIYIKFTAPYTQKSLSKRFVEWLADPSHEWSSALGVVDNLFNIYLFNSEGERYTEMNNI